MTSKYYPPTFETRKFHCILCGVFASQSWANAYLHDGQSIPTGIKGSHCSHCGRWSYWYEGKMIIPSEAPVEPPHPDLPEDCALDYREARDVYTRSPRAGAALLRLCLQKLMRHLGENGKNINDDIGSLVSKGLSPMVQKSLDICRVVGNNAVHPGEINLKDSPEIAQQIFSLINFIVEDRISRPREIDALYERLPETARKGVEGRDGAT